MQIKEFIEEKIRLHNLLNSENCPDDIDEQYKKLCHNGEIPEQTNLIFQKGNFYFSSHDAVLAKIKYNSLGLLEIKFNAFVYTDRKELGKQEVNLLITPTKIEKLIAQKNDIIFLCAFDKKQMGLVTLDAATWTHQVDIVNYKNIDFKLKGNIQEFTLKKKNKI